MEKIFLPAQISYLMPSDLYKVSTALFAFQKDGEISYSKRNASYLHIDQAIADQCIQTLIDYKIIEFLEQAGGVYRFKIVQPTIEAARLQPLTGIPDKPLLRLSEEIKWKQQANAKERSAEELLDEIERLKKELMSKVQGDNNKTNSLPW